MPPWLKRLFSDSAIGILSGLIGGIFSTVVLVAFSDDLRDLAIWMRTLRAPYNVLPVYDPLKLGSMDQKLDDAFNYGIRDNDVFEGILGRRNPDGSTDFDASARFKGFSRDGYVYFNFAPTHAERFGAGQFQSINRYDRDIYAGFIMANICDAEGVNSVQRVVIGVLVRTNQQQKADKAAEALANASLGSIYDVKLSEHRCPNSVPPTHSNQK
jgi:hypothetical protein